MRRIGATLRRIGKDFMAGRNLGAYVVVIICIALIAVDVIGEVESGTQLSVMIAALGLLVFRDTAPKDGAASLDTVLRDRDQFVPFKDFIADARELWVMGPSCVNISDQKEFIKIRLLDKDRPVRFIIQDPEAPGYSILLGQLDGFNDLGADIQRAVGNFAVMARWGPCAYRLAPYNPGYSMTVVNPEGPDARLVIEFYGFHNDLITQRMHLLIHRAESPRWFDHWVNQYEQMWDAARQPAPLSAAS